MGGLFLSYTVQTLHEVAIPGGPFRLAIQANPAPDNSTDTKYGTLASRGCIMIAELFVSGLARAPCIDK